MTGRRRRGRKALPFLIAGATLLLSIVPRTVAAQDERWQFGSTSSFSSGKYGTATRTDVLYTPVTARRLFDAGDVTLVFPFTCIWGDGSVTVVNGSAVRQQRITNTASTASRGGRATGASSGTTASGTTAATSAAPAAPAPARACGMGDIVVRGRYFLLDERRWMPTIAVRAHVKTPTASAERNLGTGRPDEGVGVEVSRTIAGGLLAMVDGGYTFIGKPAGARYNNNWWYDVGVGQDLAKGVLNLSIFYEEDRTIVPGFANARDVLAAVTVKAAGGWHVQMSGALGLSDGAPDRGLTFGASRRF